MFERLEPRAGGLARLRMKMAEADRQSRFELRVVGAVASILIFAFVGVSTWHESGPDLAGLEKAERAHNVEVPTGDLRVRFVWVVQ